MGTKSLKRLKSFCVFWALVLVWLFPISSLGNDSVRLMSAHSPFVDLTPSLRILEDVEGKLTFEEILKGTHEFVPVTALHQKMGSGDGISYWARAQIVGDAEKVTSWVIEMEPPRGTLQFFLSQDGVIEKSFRTGLREPFLSRDVKHSKLFFEVTLLPGERKTIHLQFRSGWTFSLLARSPGAAVASEETRALGLGMFYGASIFLIALNVAIFVFFREKSYLFYIAYIVFFTARFAQTDGLAHRYYFDFVREIIPRWQGFVTDLTVLFFFLFSMSLLDIKRYSIRYYQVCKAFVFIVAILAVLEIIQLFPISVMALLGDTTFVLGIPVFIYAGWFVHRRGHKPAFFYLLGSAVLGLSVIIAVFTSRGFFPKSSFLAEILRIGAIGDFVFLSLALGHRLSDLKNRLRSQEMTNDLLKEKAKQVETEKNLVEHQAKLLLLEEREKHRVDQQREEQRLSQERINAMLSVADRFNSPLTGLMGRQEALLSRIDLLRKSLPLKGLSEGEEERKQFESLLKHAQGLQEGIDGLKTLAEELNSYRESDHALNSREIEIPSADGIKKRVAS